MTVTNAAVSRVFGLIADLLEVKGGDDAAKAAAYRRAARTVESYPLDVETLHHEGRLREIPGVGEALARKIAELVETGRLRYFERLSTEIPSGVLEFTHIPGVGVKTAGLLWRELGLDSVDRLEEAVGSGFVRRLPGVGPKKEETILSGIAAYRRGAGRHPLGLARPVGLALVEDLSALPGVERAALAGSTRRWRETVGNLDLVAATTEPGAVAEAFGGLPQVREVLTAATGPALTEVGAALHDGLTVALRLVPPERFWAALGYFTGSREHGDRLAARAVERGLRFGRDGLESPGGDPVPLGDEEELYRRLDLPFLPPELREEPGAERASNREALPRLIELGDIRGDLHVHSNWSDGAASLEELAAAGQARGYEYLGVADHTKFLPIARGLDEKRLLEQKEAVEALNAQLDAGSCRLLAGVEVDILPDGRLDLPDAVLAEMDIVTASIHSGLRQPAERITERLVGAIKNEHVDVIAHPTGRLIGQREASSLDLEAVLEAAATNRTKLEINASPERLDLRDADAARAKAKGCLLTVSTDAHHTRVLDDMAYGVATARRAWLEPADVLNTRTLRELRKLLPR